MVMEGGRERFGIHIAHLRSYPASWVGSKSSFLGLSLPELHRIIDLQS
jgi:hypothetical protein